MNTQSISINDYGGVEIVKPDGTRIPTSRDMVLSRKITRYSTAEQLKGETGGLIFHYCSAADEIPELIYRFPFSVSLLERYQTGEDYVISQIVTTPNLYHIGWLHPPSDACPPTGVYQHFSNRVGYKVIDDEIFLPPDNYNDDDFFYYPPIVHRPTISGRVLTFTIEELDRITLNDTVITTFLPYIIKAHDWRLTEAKPCYFFNVIGITEHPSVYWISPECEGRALSLNSQILSLDDSWTSEDGEPIVLMEDFYTPLPSRRGRGFGAGIKRPQK